jgi:hypothetical protein
MEVLMATRIVTDVDGREWTCVPVLTASGGNAEPMGKDVVLTCSTPSVSEPVHLTVGWQWESIASNGLARMIALASPVPRD